MLLAGALTVRVQASLLKNPSFEANYNDSFPHYGSIDEWAGGSGVNEAGGPFHNGGTPIPDQARIAFMQGSANLSQDISGLVAGKRYLIQFFYDARGCCGGAIDLSTKINGEQLDRIANVKAVTGGKPYIFRSVPFTAAADTATLTFTTTAQGDATVNLDAVSIVQRDEGNVPVMNSSFEASGDVADTGLVSPAAIGGWEGTGQYGINLSGAGPFADNGTAPEQDHVAFLQGNSSLSQTVSGLVIGKPYQLSLAYNARSGNTPHIRVMVGSSTVFEEDVTAVGASNPYKTKTVTFTASDIIAQISVAQTKEDDQTLLVDNVQVVGETQVVLPPLELGPGVIEIAPGQRQRVTVTVPSQLLASKAATIIVRTPNSAIASIVNADTNGAITLSFAQGGTNAMSFEVEGVARGVARIEVTESAGLEVRDDVTVNVSTSFVRNPSFESSAVPGGVGYGSILAWNGGSGLNTSAGPFHDNGLVPDRKQVAFIQGASTLSQSIFGLTPGRRYWLQFYYNARAAGGTTIDLTVKFAGATLISIPAIAAVGEQNPYNFVNIPFTPAAASGLLEFTTVPSGDATVLLDAISIVQRDASDLVIRNPSFEASGNATGVGYVPESIAGWDFSGAGRGININGVGPFTDNGLSSDQDRVVLLQGQNLGASQTVTGLVAGQKYTLIFDVNTRNCCSATPSSYRASFADEVLVEEEITPAGALNPYLAKYLVFTAAGTEGVLKIENTSEGDHTILVDNVRIAPGEVVPIVTGPTLAFAGPTGGNLRLSWPVSADGFVLQTTTSLSTAWTDSTAPVSVEGNQNVVTIGVDSGNRFFRLIKL